MLDKIRAVPEQKSFFIGMSLILFTPLLSFLLLDLFQMPFWNMILAGVFINFFSIVFILNAADKRHSRLRKQ
ncbi:hypothetical protein [Sutcliffiella horikoshii]